MKKVDNYCVLPFRGMQIWTDGSLKPCCSYQQDYHQGKIYFIDKYDEWWSNGLTELRQNFADGDPPKSCHLCFDEQHQSSGLRLQTLDMAKVIPDYTVTKTPEHLDITFGNICNLKCIMCNSKASSRVEVEYQQHRSKFDSIGLHGDRQISMKKNPWWEDPVQIDKMSDIVSRAKYINFSGGEPLLAPALINLLESIPKSCFIEINTNCTRLTDRHIELFKKIQGKITISLDGVGAHHEYVRHESSWAEIEHNINRLLDLDNSKFEITFSYLLQHTSVYSFPNFWNYMKNLSKDVRVSEVVRESIIATDVITINSVPLADVDKFRTWHKENPTPYDDVINTWLNKYQFDPWAHKKFREYIALLDDIRGCNFTEVFQPNWE